MKILLVNTVATEKNGITNVMLNYLKSASSQDMIFDWVSINHPDELYYDQVERRNGSMYVIPRSKKKIFHYVHNLYKLIKLNKYNIVHIHGNSHTLSLELLISMFAGCKVRMVHSHNTTCKHTLIHYALTPLFNTLYTKGLACGIEAGKWMFGKRTFTVINNGVNTDLFAFNQYHRARIRSKYNIKDNDIVIGHVGYFTAVKNQSFIVEVFHNLCERHNNYRLILIGDGNDRLKVQERVEQFNIADKVIFTGNIDNVHEFLNAIDIVLMPSLYEGLPLALIEQQANGLPCFVSDRITEEVDKTGNVKFLSLESPISDWVDAITTYSEFNKRADRAQEAIESIRKNGYSMNVEAVKLRRLYKESIDQDK